VIRRPRTLRGRLTLVFALVTAVLCLLVGVLVDFQYRNALRQALDDGLATRFSNLERDLATSGDQSVEPTLPDEEAFAQIVDMDGAVVNAAPRALLARRVLTKSELAGSRSSGRPPPATSSRACWPVRPASPASAWWSWSARPSKR
jgi:hypothetical protein